MKTQTTKTDFSKLNETIKDAKADAKASHAKTIKEISHLIYRDYDGNLVTIP